MRLVQLPRRLRSLGGADDETLLAGLQLAIRIVSFWLIRFAPLTHLQIWRQLGIPLTQLAPTGCATGFDRLTMLS
jgi:hypothetical protein